MVEDVWAAIDLPVLRKIAELEEEHGHAESPRTLVEVVGDNMDDLLQSLARVYESAYITTAPAGGKGGGERDVYRHIRLTDEGRKVVGEWPSHEPFVWSPQPDQPGMTGNKNWLKRWWWIMLVVVLGGLLIRILTYSPEGRDA